MFFKNKVELFLCFSGLVWFSFAPECLQIFYQPFIIGYLGFVFFLSAFYKKGFCINLKNSLNILFLLFISALFISIYFAFNRSIAWKAFYIPLILFFVYFSIQFSDFGKYRVQIARFLALSAFLVFIFGLQEFIFSRNILYQYFLSNPFYSRYIGNRMMSFHYHPSVLATYFLVCLPPATYLIKWPWNKKDRVLGFVGALCSVLGITLSFSRTVFGILLLLSLVFIAVKKRANLLVMIILIMLLLLGFWVLGQKFDIFKRFSLSNPYHISSLSYRVDRVNTAVEMWRLKPITGVGFNNFRYLFPAFHLGLSPYEFRIPDNMYLSLLSETGILGLFAFLVFIFSLNKKAVQMLKNSKDKNEKDFLFLTILGMMGILLNMLSYDMFYWRMPLYFLGFYSGILSGYAIRGD